MTVTILSGDAREMLATLPDESVDCCVTSPPYFGLRSYLPDDHVDKAKEMGLEQTPDDYVAGMVAVFREVRRVLKPQGTLWLNLGDSYASTTSNNGGYSNKSTLAGFSNPNTKGRKQNEGTLSHKIAHGLKPKDLIGIPWRVAFALQADGWWLRQDIIWHKPNPMPESVTDRCTKAHEYVFLLSKADRYYFDAEAIAEPAIHAGRVVNASGVDSKNANGGFGSDTKLGFTKNDTVVGETRNRRSVWTIPTEPFRDAHYAVMASSLAELCVKAGCPANGTVLDPFGGAGTTGLVADRLQRNAILMELNPENAAMAKRRIENDASLLAMVVA